ncbi:heat shock factor protein-like [Mya arenaria]|uniref:heat shock factor protein-like n=1 Tax=Mya arenaria TaxID=6604 RepID=UPI0022E948D5|nr:heat shock factor protein-like [Mya arenaria]
MECFIPRSPPQIVEGITLKFPAVLWRLVNSCTTGAISWETDGTSLKIDKIKFEDEYLNKPTFFKTKNFQSFIRQLNIYGFRKLPSHYHRGQEDSIFVYKHDCFCRGHPELLAKVVRNTAVRRTQREQSVRAVEAQVGKVILDEEVLDENPLLNNIPSTKEGVDETHPLLKSPAEPILRYGVPIDPVVKTQGTHLTTVYLNPRLSDMETIMSPKRIQGQVANVLQAINTSDDEDAPPFKKVCTFRTVTRPAELGRRATTTAESTKVSPVDELSQESIPPRPSDQLMFSCPIDYKSDSDSDSDDLGLEFDPKLYNDIPEDFSILNNVTTNPVQRKPIENINFASPLLCSGGIDVLDAELLNCHYYGGITSQCEEQILTPAYFDPGTGTVTLLLPEY